MNRKQNENVILNPFETEVEIIRYAKCNKSLASVRPLSRLRLTTLCSSLERKESNCKTGFKKCHCTIIIDFIFLAFWGMDTQTHPTPWNISWV